MKCEEFDESSINEFCSGAGIVPLSVNPRDGRVCLLLGRERWIHSWRGSCRWSGFEGSRNVGESVLITAARECAEESLGCIDMLSTVDRIHEVLLKRNYWRRIVLRNSPPLALSRYHCTYIVPVPWMEDVSDRFEQLRRDIEYLANLVQEWSYLRPYPLGCATDAVGDLLCTDESVTITREKSIIMSAPWFICTEDPSLMRATYTQPDLVRQIKWWRVLRERITRALVDHPCVVVTRDRRWNHVQAVCILREHVEKDQMRWWSVDDLHDVIERRGVLDSHRFRPYFLPVLQTILTEIRGVSRRVHDRSDPEAHDVRPVPTAPEREQRYPADETVSQPQSHSDGSAPGVHATSLPAYASRPQSTDQS